MDRASLVTFVGHGCPAMAWSAVFHVPSQQTMRRLGITASSPIDGGPQCSKSSTQLAVPARADYPVHPGKIIGTH